MAVSGTVLRDDWVGPVHYCTETFGGFRGTNYLISRTAVEGDTVVSDYNLRRLRLGKRGDQ